MKTITNADKLMKITFKNLLFVQILSALATFLGPFIDGVIVSDFLGLDYMAAFGLVTPVTVFSGALANIFNAGSQNLAGKYLGQGKSDKLHSLMTSTIIWAAFCGLILTLATLFFTKPLLILLGANESTIGLCSDYLRMFALSFVPTVITPSLIGFLQLDNGGKTSVTASFVMTASDVVLDLLAVLVFKNGMLGIGLATAISSTLSVLILFSHFFQKNSTLKFTFKDSITADIGKIIICGLPAATFLICNAIRISITNNIILGVSDLTSVAAFSIQNTFRPLTLGFTLGTGITSLLVCSVISGEENRHSLRKELGYILMLGGVISLTIGLVVIILAKYPFAFMFCIGQPASFMGLVAKIIRLYAMSIPFSMLNIIFIYYYQSMHKLVRSAVFTVLENVVFYIASAKLLSLVMGVDGVWISYLISEALTLLSICIYTWIKCGHFPKTLNDYMLLSDSFGVRAEDRLNLTAVSVEEAIGISNKISDFCRSKGIDDRRSLAAALCTEELAVLAIQNCNAKMAYVDIYLTYKNEELEIRMRDNSRPFDIKLLEGIPDENDPCANIGVRIVKGMAKDINYQVALGMNMYSVRI